MVYLEFSKGVNLLDSMESTMILKQIMVLIHNDLFESGDQKLLFVNLRSRNDELLLPEKKFEYNIRIRLAEEYVIKFFESYSVPTYPMHWNNKQYLAADIEVYIKEEGESDDVFYPGWNQISPDGKQYVAIVRTGTPSETLRDVPHTVSIYDLKEYLIKGEDTPEVTRIIDPDAFLEIYGEAND